MGWYSMNPIPAHTLCFEFINSLEASIMVVIYDVAPWRYSGGTKILGFFLSSVFVVFVSETESKKKNPKKQEAHHPHVESKCLDESQEKGEASDKSFVPSHILFIRFVSGPEQRVSPPPTTHQGPLWSGPWLTSTVKPSQHRGSN